MSDNETQSVKAEDVQNVVPVINIKVLSSTGEEVYFRVKETIRLALVKAAYSKKVAKPVEDIRFLYDGERVTDDATPRSLQMEDDDTIDVMVEQIGGFSHGRLV